MHACVYRQLFSLILVLAVLISWIPANAMAIEEIPLPAEPQAEEPPSAQTLPVETEPVQTRPDETEPAQTRPVETEPAQTRPVETEPAQTRPDETEPAQTRPDETEPAQTRPDETEPAQTRPDETEPAQTRPDETEPTQTRPDETEPAQTRPDETEPSPTQPQETEPVQTQPVETVPAQTKPEELQPAETLPAEIAYLQEEPHIPGPGLYFGQLHAHTDISDGSGSVQEAFVHAAQVEGLDFFAVTDHSESFDNHKRGRISADGSAVSTDWAAGKAAAAAVTDHSFVGIYGYEMSWPATMQLGHISTFHTPGFQSWKQEEFKSCDQALTNYYDALASVPDSVSQFNHPGTQYGSFCDFGHYSEAADRAVTLLEVGSGGQDGYRYYIKALDLGWHLAPTNNQANHNGNWGDASDGRTVVYAQSLTEEAIYEALKHYRVYATEDADLEIMYSMNGHFMGSRLKKRQAGEKLAISLSLHDPTDDAAGLAEVITSGGKAIAQQTLSEASGTLTFSLPVSSGYYFIRITQPDGDTAVTAPIWVDAEELLGISALTCETPVPVQGEETALTLELFNGEDADFLVDTLEILADGTVVGKDSSLTRIPGGSTLSHKLSMVFDGVGQTRISVRLNGSLEGSPRSYDAALSLNFRRSEQVTRIIVDGSHGNAGLADLNHLKRMAMDETIGLTIASESVSARMLKKSRFLLVSAPSGPFSDRFLNAAAAFAGYGGSIIVCGQADSLDSGFDSAPELNRLLESIGSTLRIGDDMTQDAVTNGGSPELLYADAFNRSSPWCSHVSGNQLYRHASGCTVDPGMGSWLIRGRSTTVSIDGDGDGLGGTAQRPVTLLACESLSGGGTVFAAGCLFLCDENMAESKNIWDLPYANRTIGQALLGIGGDVLPLSTIAQARQSAPGTLIRIRGYATTGTSNLYNTFPETLYLQDDTGGIAVIPFTGDGIQQGTPLEIEGITGTQNGNHTVKPTAWTVLDSDLHQYQPLQSRWESLLDPEANGGTLIQAEGLCFEIYCREDDTLAGCLLLDDNGNLAKVKIENYIFAGSDGKNDLHKKIRRGRTVRACGILHVDELGEPVIRVRNCEEVVWVPSRNYRNPLTGDFLLPGSILCAATSLAGLLLMKRRKNTPQK